LLPLQPSLQSPQWVVLDCTSVSQPSRAESSVLQLLKPDPQLTAHCPLAHDAVPPLALLQGASQPPQLLVLEFVLVSQPL